MGNNKKAPEGENKVRRMNYEAEHQSKEKRRKVEIDEKDGGNGEKKSRNQDIGEPPKGCFCPI